MELGSSTDEIEDGDLLEILVDEWTTLREERDGVASDSRYRVNVA